MSELIYRGERGSATDRSLDLTPDEVDQNFRTLDERTAALSLIHGGAAGAAGFSLGSPHKLPPGFSPLAGYTDPASENFGNIVFRDGSQMIVLAQMFYRIGHADNLGYSAYGVNSIQIKYPDEFPTTAGEAAAGQIAAEADGYAVHRAFWTAGKILPHIAVDKYLNSKVANGAGFSAASIKNGAPISTSSAHNPIADLTACTANAYYECINAPKARDGESGAINPDSIFHCETRFITAWLQILQIAHGQAATSTANCAWHDAAGVKSVPANCDNNALGSVDHADVSYTSDGYSNCCLAGSGTPYAKTTHNGQACGVEVGGTMWRVNIGMTRSSENDNFYVLKKSVDPRLLTAGENGTMDAWGNNAHLADLYDILDASHITHASAWARFGNGANAVLSGARSGAGYELTGLGLPMNANAKSGAGTNLFGKDGVYEYRRALLCVRSGANWGDGSLAGAGAANLSNARSHSSHSVGFRAACSLSL